MMKFAASLVFAGALVWCLAASAQNSSGSSAKLQDRIEGSERHRHRSLRHWVSERRFNATLDDTLDTRKTKAGDPVTAETAEDVTYERCMIFPKGTKIVGHVVRVTSGGRGKAGSAIFVQFDKAMMKDGQEVMLNAGIQALAVGAVAPMPIEPKSPNAASADGAGRRQRRQLRRRPAMRLVVSTIYEAPRTTLRPPLTRASGGGRRVHLGRPVLPGEQGRVWAAGLEGLHADVGRFARDRAAVGEEEHASGRRHAPAAGRAASAER